MGRTVVNVQPLPRMERIKTHIEHTVDTRSARFGAWLLRRTKGRVVRLWHRQALVLTTRGRRSGVERTVPLQFFPDGDRMIVVAANSGLPTRPGWYFNLTADPGLVLKSRVARYRYARRNCRPTKRRRSGRVSCRRHPTTPDTRGARAAGSRWFGSSLRTE